mgnify:CR=1 FL=1
MKNFNAGKQIKILAIILAIIILTVGIILSYNYAEYTVYGYTRYHSFNNTNFIIGIAIFAVVAYVSSIFLYGFGELVENSAKIAENTSKLLEEQKKNESDTTKDSINMN